MLDPMFGSHYVSSAIDLVSRAASQVTLPVPNIPEAIRLYEAAIKDLDLGLEEIELLRDQVQNPDAKLQTYRERRTGMEQTLATLRRQHERRP